MMKLSRYIRSSRSGSYPARIVNHRHLLWHRWGKKPFSFSRSVLFIALNPANRTINVTDNKTLRNCYHAATLLPGIETLLVVNLFSKVAQKPMELYQSKLPVLRKTDDCLRWIIPHVGKIVCCWGEITSMKHRLRIDEVLALLANKKLHCFGTTGPHPRHPAGINDKKKLEKLFSFTPKRMNP